MHTQIFSPTLLNASVSHGCSHEVFYFTTLTNEVTELWVLDKGTVEVVIKRANSKYDWTCNSNNDVTRIDLLGYQ
jgi:hypothetical protein